MAEEIEFHLKTTGDPKGAEEVEKSIFKAEDAAKQASRQADVDIAKGKQAAAVQREQADALREIADGQQMLRAGELSKHLTTITAQLGEIGPEAELAFSGVQTFLNVFATTGNPIAATFALAGSAIGDVITAYRNAATQAKELSKQEQEDLRKLARFRAEYAAQLRAENLAAFYERETTALNKQVEAIESLDRIKKAQREAATAVANAFGGSQSPLQEAQAERDRGLADIAARVAKAEELARVATTQATLAASTAQMTAQNEGAKSPAAIAAENAAKQAQEAAERSALAVEEVRAIAEADKQKVLAAFKEREKEAIADYEKQITESATAVRDAIQRTADEKGSALEADIKGSFDILTKLLGDSIPNAQQQAQIIQAMTQAAGSRDAVNSELSGYFRDSSALQKSLLNEIQKFRSEVAELKTKLEGW